MSFYSKILLFGEHTIVRGGHALAMPLKTYEGTWQNKAEEAEAQVSNKALLELHNYLINANLKLILNLDLDRFQQELSNGLYFKSNIPIGYGLGSSGTVCAAVYNRFGINKLPRDQFTALKKGLAQIENFYHGSSSGLDPLICYLNQALYLEGSHFKPVQIPDTPSDCTLFLLDTKIPRSTGPLVQFFQKRLEEDSVFKHSVNSELLLYNEKAIKALLNANWISLIENFENISRFQFQHQLKMIPESLHNIWQEGLRTEHFKLKICGAGGGGFMLGLSSNFEQTKNALADFDIIVV